MIKLARNGRIKISKLLASAIAAVTAVSVMPVSVFAEENDNNLNGAGDSEIIEITLSDIIYLEDNYSIENGIIDLRLGNYEKWIDRIDIPESARTLYDSLNEWTDNDGFDDFLIDTSALETIPDSNGNKYKAIKAFEVKSDSLLTGTESKYYFAAIRAAYDAFDRDYPEVFWLSGATRSMSSAIITTTSSGKTEYTYSFYFIIAAEDNSFNAISDEYTSASQIIGDIDARDGYVSTIMSGAPSGTYERVKYFNNWLTKHNEYNYLVKDNIGGEAKSVRKCISALEGRIGNDGPVCEGYSRAMKVLCDRANIPCVLVDGNAGGAHMWNYIKMDNNCWYLVDSTWNDPTGGSSGAVSGYEREDYLLIGSANSLISSRTVANQASTSGVKFLNQPELASEDYDHSSLVSSPTITNAPTAKSGLIYDGTDQALVSQGSAENGTVMYSLSENGTYSEDVPTGKNAGTYSVWYKVKGNE